MMLREKEIILEKVSGQRRAANDVLADRTYQDHPHLLGLSAPRFSLAVLFVVKNPPQLFI